MEEVFMAEKESSGDQMAPGEEIQLFFEDYRNRHEQPSKKFTKHILSQITNSNSRLSIDQDLELVQALDLNNYLYDSTMLEFWIQQTVDLHNLKVECNNRKEQVTKLSFSKSIKRRLSSILFGTQKYSIVSPSEVSQTSRVVMQKYGSLIEPSQLVQQEARQIITNREQAWDTYRREQIKKHVLVLQRLRGSIFKLMDWQISSNNWYKGFGMQLEEIQQNLQNITRYMQMQQDQYGKWKQRPIESSPTPTVVRNKQQVWSKDYAVNRRRSSNYGDDLLSEEDALLPNNTTGVVQLSILKKAFKFTKNSTTSEQEQT